jgi:cell wall assembly regulator SMI1
MTDDVWDRFEAMLLVHAPALLASLRPPATQAQITLAESKLGVEFPAQIRQAYLRHDGSSHREDMEGGKLFVCFKWWASLDEMVQNWQMKVEVLADFRKQKYSELVLPIRDSSWSDLKIAPVWWNEKWIPIGLSNTPESTYIDLDPAPKGTLGQILEDGGTGDASWLSSGLNHYLELLIERVESGRLIFRDGWVWTSTNEPVYDWDLID